MLRKLKINILIAFILNIAFNIALAEEQMPIFRRSDVSVQCPNKMNIIKVMKMFLNDIGSDVTHCQNIV